MRHTPNQSNLLPVIVILCGIIPAHAAEVPWKLDEDHAINVVAKAYCGSLKCGKWFEDVGILKDHPPFYVFEGLGPVGGAFGYFAVNAWTGDVWDLWNCKKISSPASRKAQAEIRQRFTPAELKQYRALDVRPPNDCGR